MERGAGEGTVGDGLRIILAVCLAFIRASDSVSAVSIDVVCQSFYPLLRDESSVAKELSKVYEVPTLGLQSVGTFDIKCRHFAG